MSFLLFKVPELKKIDELFYPCLTTCLKNVNDVPLFITTPPDQLDRYLGVSIKDLYDFRCLEGDIPLPWMLPSRFNS